MLNTHVEAMHNKAAAAALMQKAEEAEGISPMKGQQLTHPDYPGFTLHHG